MAYCTLCSKKTITHCPGCNKPIPGKVHYENVTDLSGVSVPVPKSCPHCGKKFPWADKLKQSGIRDNVDKKEPGKTSWTRIVAFVVTGIAIISGLLAIFTDGFQAWGLLNPEEEKKAQPVINIGIAPVRINYSGYANSDAILYLNSKVETGNGVYKFVDSIKVDSFRIVDSSYFYLDMNNPTVEVVRANFDKMILGETAKEQNIRIALKPNYILKGDKVQELYQLKKRQTHRKPDTGYPLLL